MFYKKTGIPEEGEFVICTVKKIFPHSVFVDLDEYQNVEAMIHISEISPGRIRNIRDFVKEGRKLVCKVLRVNHEKQQIDLSLRRVPLSVKKKKNDEYKQEQRSEKILEIAAQKTKTTVDEMFKEFGKSIIEQYGNFNNFFQEYIAGSATMDGANVPKKYHKALEETIKEKIKPIKVKIESFITLSSNAPDGIERIKKALAEAQGLAKEQNYDLEITYISAPKFRLVLTTTDYKTGEKEIESIANRAIASLKKEGGSGEILEK